MLPDNPLLTRGWVRVQLNKNNRPSINTHPEQLMVSIEGNIGAGKSTLLEGLSQYLQVPVFPEKVHEWKFLKAFYEDPSAYALLFQLEVLFSFAEAHAQPGLCIVERSTATAYFVFALLLRHQGHLTADEFQLFESFWDQYNRDPDLLLYLDASADLCYERVAKRRRPGESKISQKYLQELDRFHTFFLKKMEKRGSVVVKIPAESGNLSQAAIHIIEMCEKKGIRLGTRINRILAEPGND